MEKWKKKVNSLELEIRTAVSHFPAGPTTATMDSYEKRIDNDRDNAHV
jgi:hypothetical protein